MPQLMAWHKDRYTGDIYDFTVISGPDIESDEYVYTFLRNQKFSAMSDGFGRLMVHFPKECNDLRPVMQIRNLRDSAGTELVQGGVWTLSDFEPVLNMFDVVTAYRSRLNVNTAGT